MNTLQAKTPRIIVFKGKEYKPNPEQLVFECNLKTGHVREAKMVEVNQSLDKLKYKTLKLLGVKSAKKPPIKFEYISTPQYEALLASSAYNAVKRFRVVFSKTELKHKIHH